MATARKSAKKTKKTRLTPPRSRARPAPKAPARKRTAKTRTKTARREPAAGSPAASTAKPAHHAGRVRRLSREALRLAGVGSDAVARATGKAWDQWLAILDKAGAAAMPHKAIAKLLAEKYAVPPWWSQMIAVGYEQARGMRAAYQKADGYSASVSRTMAAGVERLYGAWSDPALRSLWLGPTPAVVTRARDGKSMNLAWTAGGSRVEVSFTPAGERKSRVAVQHSKLADRAAVDEKKGFWAGALGRLKALLEKAA
jgi:uncharacterized protein YndB with AHSA1/START domain